MPANKRKNDKRPAFEQLTQKRKKMVEAELDPRVNSTSVDIAKAAGVTSNALYQARECELYKLALTARAEEIGKLGYYLTGKLKQTAIILTDSVSNLNPKDPRSVIAAAQAAKAILDILEKVGDTEVHEGLTEEEIDDSIKDLGVIFDRGMEVATFPPKERERIRYEILKLYRETGTVYQPETVVIEIPVVEEVPITEDVPSKEE